MMALLARLRVDGNDVSIIRTAANFVKNVVNHRSDVDVTLFFTPLDNIQASEKDVVRCQFLKLGPGQLLVFHCLFDCFTD